MKEASFWRSKNDGVVECQLCNHHCLIREGKKGICQVRQNRNGQLFSLNYGKLISLHVDPIEKKPLFHFLPGSKSFSIAASGCNMRCSWCQNWDISQITSRNNPERLPFTAPEQVVEAALRAGCESISYTYTEPTVFYEFVRDVSVLAKEAGLKNIWVSNGYESPDLLAEASQLIDAINIDIKAFDGTVHKKFTGANLQPILENCIRIKEARIWLEVTTLLIPGINDDMKQIEGIGAFIADKLGSDTPWHISRYFPQPQFDEISATDPEVILNAIKIGKRFGLKYVYGGNLGKGEDTYCPACGTLLIARNSLWLMQNLIKDGHCPNCGEAIAGVWS